jgi:hypothetical protein
MFSLKAVLLATGLLAGTADAPPGGEQPVAAVKKADKKGQKKAGPKANKKADTLAAVFKKLDANNDGKLSPAEFAKLKDAQTAVKTVAGKVAKKAKPAKKKANKGNKAAKGKKKANKGDAVFKKLDTNKDGFLSLAEFKKLTEVQQAAKTAKKAKKAKKNKK